MFYFFHLNQRFLIIPLVTQRQLYPRMFKIEISLRFTDVINQCTMRTIMYRLSKLKLLSKKYQ